jgi:hypothetical protein
LIGKIRLVGQALLELVVASGLFLAVSTTIISLVLSGRTLSLDSQDSATATRLAEEGLEASRLIRDSSWDNLTIGTFGLLQAGGNWQFSGSSDVSNGFTRTVSVSSVSTNSKLVISKVTWSARPARTPNVILSTLLTNWETTEEENNLEGDWTHPVSAGTADVDSGAQGTDVLVDSGIVYLSSSSSQQSKPDISIFNVADPNNPIKLSSKDMGVSTITKITKTGHYVFGSISGSDDELVVIDVANPNNPVRISGIYISDGKAFSIRAVDTRLYIGMEKLSGEAEFFILDISTPTNPVTLGSFEVNATINEIDVFGTRAYLATSHDSEELIILDVAVPAAISKLGAYNAPSSSDATSVDVKDEFNVYLGRDVSSTANEFFYLNAGTPSSVSVKGSYNLSSKVNDLIAVDNLVFMVTEQSSAEFRILNVSNPSSITTHATLNFPQVATAIDFENNTAYVAVRSNSALRIIKSSP